MKLLIIEDQFYASKKLKSQLAAFSHVSDTATHADKALHLLSVTYYDAVILDLGIRDMHGFQLLAKIPQAVRYQLPVIVTSAKDSLQYRLNALNNGADDYLAKPYEILELDARLRTIWRRMTNKNNTELLFGDLQYDTRQRQLTCNKCTISLPKREGMLVEALIQSAPRIVIKQNLEENLYSLEELISSNAVEALVSRVRRKLQKLRSTNKIVTNRGIGYRLVAPE